MNLVSFNLQLNKIIKDVETPCEGNIKLLLAYIGTPWNLLEFYGL